MGKGHGQKKKINELIAAGNIKGAKEALATSKERLSRSAHEALSKHLQTKLRLRKKMGAANYKKMVTDRSKAIKKGMNTSTKEAKRKTRKVREAIAQKVESRRESRRMFNMGD